MRYVFLLAALISLVSCGAPQMLEERVFVVNVKQDEDSLQKYISYHNKIWPEVEQGFRQAGYRQIRLLRSHHTIVMIITVPKGANLDEMGKKAEAYHPRCAAWNRLMSGYQQGVPGTAIGQTWSEALQMYVFENK